MKRLFVVAICLVLSSCAVAQLQVSDEEMYIKASALTKLTAAVEGHVRYDSPDTSAVGDKLLSDATAHDPSLLQAFSEMVIQVRTQNRHASLLVCTADRLKGLLEDVGCTGMLDRHLWQLGDVPCVFTLDIEVVCGKD